MAQQRGNHGEDLNQKKHGPKRQFRKKACRRAKGGPKVPDQFEGMNGVESSYFKKG